MLAGGWRFFTGANGPGSVFVQALAVLLMAAGLVHLLSADPPWALGLDERTAAGKAWRVRDYAQFYSWWAALINVVVLAGVLVLSRWWARPVPVSPEPAPGRFPAWLWVGLAAVVVLGAVWRVPRLDQSLWNDEEYGVRRYVWGGYEASDPTTGPVAFDRLTWQETFFNSASGNNHLWSAFEARLAHSAWESVARPDPVDFSETALRVPALVAGLLTIVLTGVLGAQCGRPAAGLAAAAIVALSPWAIRYSGEVRGYGSLLFFILATLLCLERALESGRWRWWLGFAAAQAIYLLCFAGSLYVAIAMNASAAVLLLARWRRQPGSLVQLGRLGVANAFSAVVVLQWILPSVPQILAYLRKEDHLSDVELGKAWFLDFWSHLVLGVQWSMRHDVPHHGLGFRDLAAAEPAVWWGVVVLVPLLLVVGAVRMAWSGGWRERIVLASLLGATVLAYGHNEVSDSKMFVWYLLYAVPALALCLARAVSPPVAPVVPGTALDGAAARRRWMGAAALVLVVAGYGWLSADPRRRLATHDRQPMAEAVRLARGAAHSGVLAESPVLTATFGVSDRQIQSYDPRVEILGEVADLDALRREAEGRGIPLFVYICGPPDSRARRPDLFAAVAESGEFEKVADVPGLEPYFSYALYRLRVR